MKITAAPHSLLDANRQDAVMAGAGLGLAVFRFRPMCRRMSRIAIAVPVGLLGFLLYIGLVVALADHVLAQHWLLQVPYFVIAGVAWAFPAKWLMFWAAGQR